MKSHLRGIAIVFIGFLLSIGTATCCTGRIKLVPEYKGVDSRVQGIVDDYKDMAKNQGVIFKKHVTIGFTKIKDPNVVGYCTYGLNWREIDIDIDYWNNTTTVTHRTLLWHELGHCYCGRDHDYGNGALYPENSRDRKKDFENLNGYYKDGSFCPLSIMFPMVLEDECVFSHYRDYTTEMFSRCKPW